MAGVEIILFLTAYSITILFKFNNSLGPEVGGNACWRVTRVSIRLTAATCRDALASRW